MERVPKFGEMCCKPYKRYGVKWKWNNRWYGIGFFSTALACDPGIKKYIFVGRTINREFIIRFLFFAVGTKKG